MGFFCSVPCGALSKSLVYSGGASVTSLHPHVPLLTVTYSLILQFINKSRRQDEMVRDRIYPYREIFLIDTNVNVQACALECAKNTCTVTLLEDVAVRGCDGCRDARWGCSYNSVWDPLECLGSIYLPH